MQVIGDENLIEWGVSFYEAMEIARQNLEEATVSYSKIGDGLYSFISGDRYDASRITLLERSRQLEVNGKPVAMVSNRDELLVTGSDDDGGLTIMATLAEKGLDQPYPLSGVPLIFDDGAWQDWMPPEGHPLHRTFKQMEINWIGPLYHEQKKLLDAIHEKQGIDIFVASFSVFEHKDGRRLSYCVWTKGVDSLLPVTQKVAFVKGQGIPAVFADWSRVVETFADLMEQTDDYPRRYRVREFPDEATIDAIQLTEWG